MNPIPLRYFMQTPLMRILGIFFLALCVVGCREGNSNSAMTVQQIVDRSIEVSGGSNYENSRVSFIFRDRTYESENIPGKKVLRRITSTDSLEIVDVKENNTFRRYFNDSLIALPDTIAVKYANSVNSVHYFSRLPYGLNDKAVNKELLGEVTMNGIDYYKVKVTFDQENGGDDFEDAYLYWFDKSTFKPTYLAYEFHVDGGGMRFREALNERFVSGIRFVDYNNYKPVKGFTGDFDDIDSLFDSGQLELLSKIELKGIEVN